MNLFRLKKNSKYKILFYVAIIGFLAIISIFPQVFSGYTPIEIDPAGLQAPSAKHLAGTDFLGRDILSRAFAGARISLTIGVGARLFSIIIGTFVGVLAGLLGSFSKTILMKIIEIFLAIPSLLLAMALTTVLQTGYLTIMIAIAIGTWAPVARFVATQVKEIRSYDYVVSVKAIGARWPRIVFLYIFPALLPLLLPILTTGIATSIMMEATLSFLGLAGGTASTSLPSWGIMVNESVKFIFDAPWMIFPPSILLMVLVLVFNRIGDIIATDITK